MKLDQIKQPLHLLNPDDAMKIVLEVRDMRGRWVEKAKKEKKATAARKSSKKKAVAAPRKLTKEDILLLMKEAGMKGLPNA